MNFAKIQIRGCKNNLQLCICILHLHSGACKQYLQSVLGIFWNYWRVSIETGGVFGDGFNTRLIEKTSATTNALVLNGWHCDLRSGCKTQCLRHLVSHIWRYFFASQKNMVHVTGQTKICWPLFQKTLSFRQIAT